MTRPKCIYAALLALGLWYSQTGALAQATNPSAQAQLGPTDFLNAALEVAGAVDRYEMASIWDRSSPVMKASIPKDRFITSTAQNRALLGAISSRNWSAIMRVIITDGSGPLPPGRYISIRFDVVGQGGKSMEEVISFHLDADGQWKLAGYSIK